MHSHSLHPLDPLAWAGQHFGAANLGDRRRVQRAVTLAAGMARQPGGSIPQLFLHRYDVKAAYTLLDRPEVTPQHLQAGHTLLVKARLQIAPDRPGHTTDRSRLPPYGCTVVRVWEANPPAGVKEPLEWFLLTDVPVTDVAQARECAHQYATRWLIEEFHKALKTGLGADKLQLETGARLKAAVALMSVVAVRLLALKEQARVDPQAPAEKSGMDAEELHVLSAATERRLTTTSEVALAVGRLGGHMNRKGDGLPGWQTLWRGMTRLATLVEGYRLGRSRFGE